MGVSMKEILHLGEFQLGESANVDLGRLLRERLLIQASSGGGKSWLIRRLVEQAHGKVPIVLIDREGEFASLREKFDFVLAGKRGDTPVTIATAALLARTVLEVSANIICDLSDLVLEDQQAWVGTFLTAFVGAPEELWKDFLVILDEAHLFAPEEGKVSCKKAVANLTSLGRKRGYGAVLATHRLGKLDKDIAAELQNVFIGKTVLDIDRDRAARALDISRVDKLNFFKSIRRLTPGIFYGYGNAIVADEPRTLKVGPVSTTHREPGARVAAIAPPPTDAILHLLPRFKGLGAQVKREEQHRLEDAVEDASARAALETRCKDAEARVVELEAEVTRLAAQCEEVTRVEDNLSAIVKHQTTTINDAIRVLQQQQVVERVLEPPRSTGIPTTKVAEASGTKPPQQPPKRVTPKNGDAPLLRGEMAILTVAVAHYPNPCSLEYLALATGFVLAGGFHNYIRNLKTRAYLAKADSTSGYVATPLAAALFRGKPVAPSQPEILNLWVANKLTGKEKNIVHVFYEANGEPISLQRVAKIVEMQMAGGFHNYVRNLKKQNLIVKGIGGYKISPYLVGGIRDKRASA